MMITKLLLFLSLLASAGNIFAQGVGPGGVPSAGSSGPVQFPGAPTGSCTAGQTAVNTATGDFYSCAGGTWNKINGSGGPPNGAAGGALSGTYPNPGLVPSSVTSAISGQAIAPASVAATASVNAPILGSAYQVAAAPSSCTINSVTSATQAGCAFLAASLALTTTGNPQSIVLPPGVSLTDVPWTLPSYGAGFSTPTISIFGQGSGDTPSSTLRASAAMTNLISTTGTQYRSQVISGVSFDGNGLVTGQVMSLSYLYGGTFFPNVEVRGACTATTCGGYLTATASISNSYEINVAKLKVVQAGTSSLATISTSVSGGVPTLTVSSGGSNYANGPTLPVMLVGPSVTSFHPCTDPGEYSGNIVSGALSSITTVRAAVGCSGFTQAVLPDNAPQQYGLYFSNVSDYTIGDAVTQSVGNQVYVQGTISNCTIDGSGNATLALSSNIGVFTGAAAQYAFVTGLSTCTALNGHSWLVQSATSSQVVLTTTAASQASVADVGDTFYADRGAGVNPGSGGGYWGHLHPYYGTQGVVTGKTTIGYLELDSNFSYGLQALGVVNIQGYSRYYNSAISTFLGAKVYGA